MNYFNVKNAIGKKEARGWDYIYWCIDIHDVVFTGLYDNGQKLDWVNPTCPAILRWLTEREDHKLIMWTCSHQSEIDKYKQKLAAHGIRFDFINENPDCPSDELCDFSKKLYYNIMLEDKAGFEAGDWVDIGVILSEIYVDRPEV